MPLPRSTGIPRLDAQSDFQRARRRAILSKLSARLRWDASLALILPYQEVVAALGFVSERPVGVQAVPLEAIVGTVDRGHDFDRRFRPTSLRVRSRWEQIAEAVRRGAPMPPVDLVRVGEIYFVRDGHHRVSVARALGRDEIEARVTEVVTRVGADRRITLDELPLKSHERVFFERVPLPADARAEIALTDAWDYAVLAEAVEAWGFRAIQERNAPLDRDAAAALWLDAEYRPVVAMLRDAGMVKPLTETEAYMRVAAERYRLLRTHRWDDRILAQVIAGSRRRRRRS